MKRILLLSAAMSVILAAVPAVAADLVTRPYTKAPAMSAPAWDWSGFYIGVNAGYQFAGNQNIATSGQAVINQTNVASGARPALVGQARDGFVGGGQIGYNWQWTPNWVFGFETDIQYVDVDRNQTVIGTNGVNTFNNVYSTKLDYLGTVRGRLGYTWGPTMLYATGGFAYAGVNNSATFFGPVATGSVLHFFGQDRATRTGYTVGGGIEHMFAPNWSVKAEYLYYDLGSSNLNVALVPGSGGAGTGYNTTVRNDGHIARAGLNYKFGGPIVAAY